MHVQTVYTVSAVVFRHVCLINTSAKPQFICSIHRTGSTGRTASSGIVGRWVSHWRTCDGSCLAAFVPEDGERDGRYGRHNQGGPDQENKVQGHVGHTEDDCNDCNTGWSVCSHALHTPIQVKLDVDTLSLLVLQDFKASLAGSDQLYSGTCHARLGPRAGAGNKDAHSPPMQTAKMQTEILEHSSICLPVALGLIYSR